MTITHDDFMKVDIRLGKVIEAKPFPEAKKPAIQLWIDFGPEIGVKKSSAQITQNYSPETLPGKLVAGVVNFPPRQIGPFMSEVLIVGFTDHDGYVTLVSPDKDGPLGNRLL